MSSPAEKILQAQNIPYRVGEYPQAVKSASEAATHIGIPINQMLKSLLIKDHDNFAFGLISSTAKIDFNQLKTYSGRTYQLAPIADIKPVTGYDLGSISPLGLLNNLPTYIDKQLINYPEVGIASGVFGLEIILSPKSLIKITHGLLLDVSLGN
jgi:Cys-tRNA(Pro)/Cys-tRNA(Cys) deacylase